MSYTHTYAILEVAPATFRDVKERLAKAWAHQPSELSEYVGEDDRYGEILILGTVALAVDPRLTAAPPPPTPESMTRKPPWGERFRAWLFPPARWTDEYRQLQRERFGYCDGSRAPIIVTPAGVPTTAGPVSVRRSHA